MRIGIVNDVPMTLELLRRMVSGMPGYTVAWLARHGAEAVLKCSEDTPDLILMDLIMPGIDGAETTRRIMRQCPCAILVVTASVKSNQALAFEALTAGAMDVVRTPEAVADMNGESGGNDPLWRKVRNISRIIGKNTTPARHEAHVRSGLPNSGRLLIGIGASTGGPGAITTVLSTLPEHFPVAIVIIVHVDEEFAPGMARWMNGIAKMPIRPVREGECPKVGEVLLAATNEHLVLARDQTLHYTPEPVDYPYRPSVNAFFSSLTLHWRGEAVGVLLTGMGADGAEGLKTMRQKGWHTIAQDEETSVIYGMPKAAAKIDAASEILPLERIGPKLIHLLEQPEERGNAAMIGIPGGHHN